jgi:membrane fusion protein, heavy metal efflux system
VPTVPAGAVVGYEGRMYIFVAGRNAQPSGTSSFRMMEVGTKESGSGFTQVILPEGFSKETEVVCRGAYHLLAAIKNVE